MVPTMEVVKWKYVSLVAGEQCVMMDGTDMIPMQLVDNWDSQHIGPFQPGERISVKIELMDQFFGRNLNVKKAGMYHNC